MLLVDHLLADFDEIWYAVFNKHGESKKRKTGSVTPFSKMSAAAILKINERP
jgi:hypothetical protein